MLSMSVFTLTSYVGRLNKIYDGTGDILIPDILLFLEELRKACSQVGDKYILCEQLTVSSKIHNLAIYFACSDLLRVIPYVEETEKKKIVTFKK